MKKLFFVLTIFSFLSGFTFSQSKLSFIYSHPNAETSIAGLQAKEFARLVNEKTKGEITIKIYPNSQLGTLTEQELLLKSQMIAFSHNTAASMGGLYNDFAVLDTPYMYDNVDHLLRVTNPKSPVMQKLNAGILKESNCRILYSFYFGTRQLTCNQMIKTPSDLKNVKIRSIPFDIYKTAVEGLGANPVPLDWISTKSALIDKKIDGQENPANTMVAAKMWENQKYLFLTSHIIPAEFVVMNNEIWKRLNKTQQKAITEAAQEAAVFATKKTLEQEADDLDTLKKNGMIIVTEKDGLNVQAFKESTQKLVDQKFGKTWAKYYKLIESLK